MIAFSIRTVGMAKILFRELENHGDQRSFSFSVPREALEFLGGVGDVHVASIRPQAVRGNHFHQLRREVILATYDTDWSFHWDEGEGCPGQQRQFSGSGSILVLIEPGASHAMRNDGTGTLVFAAVSSEAYNSQDSVSRKVV